MTDRDIYALFVLNGIFSTNPKVKSEEGYTQIADLCYAMADAMLRARS